MTAASCALYAGLVASGGFGEARLAPSARLGCDHTHVAAAATWEGSHKINDGAGYIFGADVDVGTRITVGFGYRLRNGGEWTKNSFWPRLGIGRGPVRFVLRQQIETGSLNLGARNRGTIAELHLRRGRAGRLGLYNVIGAGSFIDDYGRRRYGVFAQAWAGLRW